MFSNEDDNSEFTPFDSYSDETNEREHANLFNFDIEKMPIIIFPSYHSKILIVPKMLAITFLQNYLLKTMYPIN